MIAKLEFHLPEDEAAYRMANAADKYFAALCDFKSNLRSIGKYEIGSFNTVGELFDRVEKCWNEATESIDWDEIP